MNVSDFSPIYYADIHTVNNKCCIITGYGKSRVFRNHIPNSEEIASDSIRIKCKGNILIGYSDIGMGFLPFDEHKSKNREIDYLVYMSENCDTPPHEISKEEFVKLSISNITYTEQDDGSMFSEYIKHANIKCYLIPYYETVEERAQIIIKHIV